ncbi:hypothetical protein C1I95_19205 [Micromonospora craterilacus]|uniref:Uncharacterized protein n=1 Tax=Micromonospora craterilacus TaxID=1655439 RepID=A0A2W2DUK8_9ACTN|nr:hypothetical protein C1I95_19205 [Micromonospora craterilacus]
MLATLTVPTTLVEAGTPGTTGIGCATTGLRRRHDVAFRAAAGADMTARPTQLGHRVGRLTIAGPTKGKASA